MQNESKSLGSDESGLVSTKLDAVALSRRRMLLKGVGRGASVLAASVPLSTLATQNVCVSATGKKVLCTASGGTSAAHSFTNSSLPTSKGFSPSKYQQNVCGWPGGADTRMCQNSSPFPGVAVYKTTTTGNTRLMTIKEVMNSTGGTTGTKYGLAGSHAALQSWLAAWMNAQQTSYGLNYPYSAAEVVTLFSDSARRANALTLFQTYLQQA